MSRSRRGLAAAVAALCFFAACSDDDGRSIEAFCDRLDALGDLDTDILGVDLDDSDAVRSGLEEFSLRLTGLEAVAPDDIVNDVAQVADFGQALADAALEASPDDPFDRAALLAVASAQVPDVDRANEAMSTYAARHCTPAPG